MQTKFMIDFVVGFMVPVCVMVPLIIGCLYPEEFMPDAVIKIMGDCRPIHGALYGALVGNQFALLLICVKVILDGLIAVPIVLLATAFLLILIWGTVAFFFVRPMARIYIVTLFAIMFYVAINVITAIAPIIK